MTETFVLLVLFKMLPSGLWMSVPKHYPTYEKCMAAGDVVKKHYNAMYDPEKKFTNGDIVDTLCL